MTNPGDLDNRIRIERRVLSPDGAGGGGVSWVLHSTVWAKAEMGTRVGAEENRAGASTSITRYAFTLRDRTDLNTAMRVAWDGRTFAIRSIERLGRSHAYLILRCDDGAAT